jgi:hypothetical protein
MLLASPRALVGFNLTAFRMWLHRAAAEMVLLVSPPPFAAVRAVVVPVAMLVAVKRAELPAVVRAAVAVVAPMVDRPPAAATALLRLAATAATAPAVLATVLAAPAVLFRQTAPSVAAVAVALLSLEMQSEPTAAQKQRGIARMAQPVVAAVAPEMQQQWAPAAMVALTAAAVAAVATMLRLAQQAAPAAKG